MAGLWSCKHEQTFPVSLEKMVNVLIDIHCAEAAVQHIPGLRKDTVIGKYYEQIYQIHGIEKTDFDSTLALITGDPIIMKEVYGQVMDSIELRSTKSIE